MAASGMIGHAQVLEVTSGTPFVVTDLTNIQFSGKATDSIEISSESSPINAKEFIPGMIDHGTCTFTCNYKEAMHKTLADLQDARTSATWKHTRPDASYLTFVGFIMSDDRQFPHQGKTEMTYTIKITGLPVITTA